jgi:hypothetical protein
MNNIVDFRFSDSDFATYLTMIGYEYKSIEITEDNRHDKRIKAFIHFDGEKEKLIELHNIYLNGKVNINLKEFSIAKQYINKAIKEEISKYNNNICNITH